MMWLLSVKLIATQDTTINIASMQAFLEEFLDKKVPQLFSDPTDRDKFKRNLLKVEVYLADFEYESRREEPTYEVKIMVFSNIVHKLK